MRIWPIQSEPRRTKIPQPQPLETIPTWHYHKEMEIVVRVEGEMLFYVEGDETYSLKSGDVIVVGPSQLHASRSAPLGKGAQMVCQFDLQHYLDPLFAPYAPYLLNAFVPLSKLNKAIHRNKELTNEIYRGIMSIYGESQKRSFGYELAIGNHMKHILLLLLRIGRNEGIFEGAGAAYAPLRHVFDYVEGHVTEKIRLEDACKLANMSYHYFSRYFKKTVGLSFVEFVNYKRLKAAERLLATSQHLTIADIAEQVGIPNVAHFYETFRRVNGCSPAEFKCRLMHRIGSTPSSER